MPVITYRAVDRGELAQGHTAGTVYQIEFDMNAFPRDYTFKGSRDETLDGTPEGWLDAIQKEWDITTDLIYPSQIAYWREFITSVANCETFSIDFTGTVETPGTPIDVYLAQTRVREVQENAAGFRYSFVVKAVP